MQMKAIAALAAATGVLTGCAGKPREFRPELSTAPADQGAFDRTVGECRAMVAKGRRSNFVAQRAGTAGVGVAAGYATGAALFAGTGGSMAAGVGAASVAVVAMPIIGIAAAYGVSRAVRSGKEREIQAAMTTCLGEHGYTVSGWRLPNKGGPRTP